eukprot:4498307-Prymnesium_polylepis.1
MIHDDIAAGGTPHDSHLRPVDDGRELLQAEHAQVGDSERAADELGRLQLALLRLTRQGLRARTRDRARVKVRVAASSWRAGRSGEAEARRARPRWGGRGGEGTGATVRQGGDGMKRGEGAAGKGRGGEGATGT